MYPITTQEGDYVENLLSISEAANRLGISRHTLNGWVSKRKVPFIKLGRRTLFNPADLERLIKAATVKPENLRELS
jgi:excisionase family DNA binding protein